MHRLIRALPAAAAAGFMALVLLGGCGDEDLVDPAEHHPTGPAAREFGEPAGEFTGSDPRGVVILLHGGGWQPNEAAYQEQIKLAPLYRDQGYATLAIAYRAGQQGLRDVLEAYEKARERYPRTPICAVGASAGGHLALMLATREPDLACVIDLSGPTDLSTLEEQGGSEANRLAVAAFGPERLERFSPIERANEIEAEVLLVFAEDDPVVPEQQGEQMARALPRAELIVLPPGDSNFIHGPGVDEAAKQQAGVEQAAFLERATTGG